MFHFSYIYQTGHSELNLYNFPQYFLFWVLLFQSLTPFAFKSAVTVSRQLFYSLFSLSEFWPPSSFSLNTFHLSHPFFIQPSHCNLHDLVNFWFTEDTYTSLSVLLISSPHFPSTKILLITFFSQLLNFCFTQSHLNVHLLVTFAPKNIQTPPLLCLQPYLEPEIFKYSSHCLEFYFSYMYIQLQFCTNPRKSYFIILHLFWFSCSPILCAASINFFIVSFSSLSLLPLHHLQHV